MSIQIQLCTTYEMLIVAPLSRESEFAFCFVHLAPCYFLIVIVFKNVQSAFSSSCPVGNLFACMM